MKVVRKPIDVICWFEQNGSPHPVRFQLEDEEHNKRTVKIHKLIKMNKEKLAGNPMYIFTCQIVLNQNIKICEIKYELLTCKWILFKI